MEHIDRFICFCALSRVNYLMELAAVVGIHQIKTGCAGVDFLMFHDFYYAYRFKIYDSKPAVK